MQRDGDVATVRFTTETGVNVFSSAVIDELGSQIEQIAADASIRFVVFRGAGKTFVAGADIREMAQLDEPAAREFSRRGQRVFDEIERMPQVTFAAINGHALGGGCELALACDFRIMVRSAKIGQPESRLGLIPGWGGTQRLPRLVGPAHARRLMMSGEPISAEHAQRIGLVDEVVLDEGALDPSLAMWFAQMRNGSPNAITLIKQAMVEANETQCFGRCFACRESREGMQAFLNKRPACWMEAREA